MGQIKTIGIFGSSGFIGSHLKFYLEQNGYEVFSLKREDVQNEEKLLSCDVIIFLAGKNIFSSRWTKAIKGEILSSRVDNVKKITQTLENSLKEILFISASAIGFYGDRKNEVLTENSTKGSGFLADVCENWEGATKVLNQKVRVVNLRLGLVIDKNGGFLAKLLPIVNLGLGSILGQGKQYLSFIHLQDLLRVFLYVIKTPTLTGAVNAVAPFSVTNEVFMKALASYLKKPLFLKIPAFFLNLFLGESASVLLFSQRVYPEKLINSGFEFKKSKLSSMLE